MAVAQNVSGILNFSANFQQLQSFISQVPGAQVISQSLQYVNATGQALGIDQMYAATGSLVSTSTTLHFETSTLHDIFGNTISMARIRELIIVNNNTTIGQDLKVYAPASNAIAWLPPVANFLSCRSGTTTASNGYGILRFSDPASFGGGIGQAVGATSDGLTLDSGSNTISYTILALGCSVA